MDYARFAHMLLNGGALDGNRVLGKKTVSLMTNDQLSPTVNRGPFFLNTKVLPPRWTGRPKSAIP